MLYQLQGFSKQKEKLSNKVKIGDYLYRLDYSTHPFKKFDRVVVKRKIKKITNNYVIFSDKNSVKIKTIDNISIDRWYTSPKRMYIGKLQGFVRDNTRLLSEIEYLKKKIGEKNRTQKRTLSKIFA